MMDWLTRLLDPGGFPARWNCGTGWTPFLGWLHILSDIAIWGAYMAIPLTMWFFARHRRDIKLPRVFWLYIGFILACGIGHLIEAGIFYWPLYRLSGLSKLITAAVSWATIVAIIQVMPTALSLPGMAKVNADLKREVDQRRKAESQLERLNQKLHDRNQSMRSFLYSVSHDLKAPVVTIKGFSEYIRSDLEAGRPDRLQQMSGRILDAAEQMSVALEDLLVLARLGHTEMRLGSVSLAGLVQDVVDSARPAIDQAGADVRIGGDLPELVCDESQLRRLMENLLANAIEHGQSPGRDLKITIEGRREDGRARLCVRDNGPGIAPEYHERIFNAFERVQNKPKGTGLGLSIVKRIVDNHGGRVWVESSATDGEPGVGFWIELPLVPHDGHAIENEVG